MNTATATTQPNCKARWRSHKDSRLADLRDMFKRMRSDDDSEREQASTDFCEYGLSFDYVAPGTWPDQHEGYWRYQISWGGPSDEFRFYASSPDSHPDRIEYWFMDWFDGYGRGLVGTDLDTMLQVWSDFEGMGATQTEYDKAMEG